MVPAATQKRAVLEAKRKSAEENTASLIQDEEDAWSSEPDPVSTTGLATALSSTASREDLKEVSPLLPATQPETSPCQH